VPLASKDGSRVIEARPLDVVSSQPGVIKIDRKDGGPINLPVDSVGTADQARLRAWIDQVTADPHHQVTSRVAGNPAPTVLFVGNSYSFHLAETVRTLARAEGHPIETDQIVAGGWTLARHAASPATLGKIRGGKWDVVVLQEQSLVPAFPAGQRDNIMFPAVAKLAETARAAGALPVLYQTWGRRDGDRENAHVFPDDTFAAMHARLREGIRGAAQSTGSLAIVPVGDAWAAEMTAGRGRELFANDGSHPSRRGLYLNACVFYVFLRDLPVKSGLGKEFAGTDPLALEAAAAGALWQPPPLAPTPAVR
jgi:hypothetical protein